MRRASVCVGALGCALIAPLASQESATLGRARQAFNELAYDSTIALAQRALSAERLSRADRIQAYELLAFSYGSIDSTSRAVEAFREEILLDPDREPDVVRVSPRITSLYSIALGQVLVVRRVRADTASFVAGAGGAPIHFQVSRAARVTTRVVGGGLDLAVDSQSLAGSGLVSWHALAAGGGPVPPGRYEVVVEAVAGRDRFSSGVPVIVTHGARDTLPYLTALPGYAEQPETETPLRDWTPMGLAALYTTLGSALGFTLQSATLRQGAPRELVIAGAAVLGVGLVQGLRRPEPRAVPAAILYNRLLRDILARRNADIAQQNQALRRQAVLTVTPAAAPR